MNGAWDKLRPRLSGLFPLAVVLPLLCVVVALAWIFAPGRQPASDAQRDDVPPARRYAGLDLFKGEGFRLPAHDGIKSVTIGTFLIQRKKTGFLRLGAFNEAVLSDVRIVLDAAVLLPAAGPSNALAATAGPASPLPQPPAVSVANPPLAVATVSDRLADTLVRLASEIRPALMAQDTRISSVRIRNVDVLVGRLDGSEYRVLHGGQVRSSLSSLKNREFVLEDGVTLATVGGEVLTCETAVMVLRSPATVTARKGTIESRDSKGGFKELSVPLARWLGAEGTFVPPSPPMPAEGKHTPRHGVRLVPKAGAAPVGGSGP
jgi:hypothetical protein